MTRGNSSHVTKGNNTITPVIRVITRATTGETVNKVCTAPPNCSLFRYLRIWKRRALYLREK